MIALSVVWAFLKRIPWEVWMVLMLAAGIALHLHKDAGVRDALVAARKSEQAAILTKQLYKDELDRVLADLADAKTAGDKAIADKAEAEKAAAKKLAAERKKWARILSTPGVNKAWAESAIPPDVLEGLR